jgi:phenylacetate-CoA ligase
MALLLRHAARHSPFWRDRIAAAGDPELPGTFAKLPITTRAEMQSFAPALGARWEGLPERDIVVSRTSGSTGHPVTVEKAQSISGPLYRAAQLVEHLWQGLEAGAPRAIIRDAPDAETIDTGPRAQVLGRASPLFVRNLVKHSPEALLDWLREVRPRSLVTVPSMLSRLAELALADGEGPAIPHILTTSEPVAPELRTACRAAFSGRIVDRYSCEELGWIALQCPIHDHLHALSSLVHLEIVDEAGAPCPPGVPGRVVVTGLHSFAMPIIRYELGDVAEWGEACDCGLTLPVIRRIFGRRRNFLRLPDGSERLARLVGDRWHAVPAVQEFRLLQHADLVVQAVLRCARPLSAEERSAAKSLVQQVLGHPFEVVVTETDRIDWGRSWKRDEFVRIDTPWSGPATDRVEERNTA